MSKQNVDSKFKASSYLQQWQAFQVGSSPQYTDYEMIAVLAKHSSCQVNPHCMAVLASKLYKAVPFPFDGNLCEQ